MSAARPLAREVLAVFHGGPCDGGVEALLLPPAELRFSSARIDGEWHDGTLRVADVVYLRDPGNGPVVAYRFQA